jgi:uncharacterized protein
MTATNPPAGGGADPSMEDILASIRRILSEDDAEAAPAAAAQPDPRAGRPDVLALDASMLVDQPAPLLAPPDASRKTQPAPPPVLAVAPPVPQPAATPPAKPAAPFSAATVEPSPHPALAIPPSPPAAPVDPQPDHGSLIGAEAAAAASSSVGSLLRTLANERQQVAVYRGGPTLEDLVREEIRPLLKQWLDVNLPPIVERLVRAEIERVVGRSLS